MEFRGSQGSAEVCKHNCQLLYGKRGGKREHWAKGVSVEEEDQNVGSQKRRNSRA